MTTTKRLSSAACATIRANSTTIASTNIHGGDYSGDIGAWWVDLRTHKGKYLLLDGGGLGHHYQPPIWLADRDAAKAWIVRFAEDAVTGYGFTDAQADELLDGGNPRGETSIEPFTFDEAFC